MPLKHVSSCKITRLSLVMMNTYLIYKLPDKLSTFDIFSNYILAFDVT